MVLYPSKYFALTNQAICDGKIDDLIKRILDDEDYVYCFQEEYAVVAIAIKRFQETIDDFNNNNLLEKVEVEKIEYIYGIIPDEFMVLKKYIKNLFSIRI